MSRFVGLLMLAVASLGLSRAAPAQTTPAPAPDRVEEDWQLVIATPDVTGIGPQITTSMCPAADATKAPFVALDMNYREYPSFAAGGLQAQIWSAGNLLKPPSSSAAMGQLAIANETITWTQQMSIGDGKITYQVRSSSSRTWGAFDDISASFNTTLTSLSGYSPATTVKNSGVSWQVNNVQTMTLVAVRYYANRVLLSTDSTARPVVTNGASVAQAPTCAMRPRPLAPRSGRVILASTCLPASRPARDGAPRPLFDRSSTSPTRASRRRRAT
jgi:hypothetical protein